MRSKDSARYSALLGQRLREAARVLNPGGPPSDAVDALGLLGELAESVRLDPAGGRLWLLFTAVAGAFPTPSQHEALRRRLVFAQKGEAGGLFLDGTLEAASERGDWDRPLRIAEDVVFVDVNFCAKFIHNTGIQRVVREVMPYIVELGGPTLELVAWTRRSGVMRALSAIELQRVTDWRALAAGTSVMPEQPTAELIVPWKSKVFLPEVPEPALCDRLSALAQFSGNSVAIIGYDAIPIASADLVLPSESERFARYLSVVKHVDRVVAISESVKGEFAGFADALHAQGLEGPAVSCVVLAADVPEQGERPVHVVDEVPIVLSVGSHEPRKNQGAVLFAAERLLADGLDFRMVFVGGGNRTRTAAFDRRLRHLRATRGWKIESARGMKDRELWELYRSARFSVFTSLHEGYGLPVVESLALGTPVLTSNYGSLAEIAAGGGCVMVDPRDDEQIVAAMRKLLTDDALIARLTKQAEKLPSRTWRDYAVELWASAGLASTAEVAR